MLLPLTILTVSEPLMCMHGTQCEWPMEALDTVDQIVQLMKTSKKKRNSPVVRRKPIRQGLCGGERNWPGLCLV